MYIRTKTKDMKAHKIIIALTAILSLAACRSKGDDYAFQYVSFKETLP